MNGAHIHLVSNHFPIVGVFFAIVVSAYGAFKKDQKVFKVGLALFVISFLFGIPAYFSGEGAEEVVEHMSGISEKLIHPHEEAAEKAIVLLAILGISSIAGFFVWKKKEEGIPNWFQYSILGLGFVSLLLLGWTANLGGKIHHPELRSGFKVKEHDEKDEEHEKSGHEGKEAEKKELSGENNKK
ncbi:MAG: hypothetical protein D6785_02775 [Planctomycetota bacterium]|nr:MAG: hypothetical protein D6785_02775 [Planctomycetota bacterium]